MAEREAALEAGEGRGALSSGVLGMTLFLFMVQVSTGILLLLYYRPSAEEAFESVQFLMGEVRYSSLTRTFPKNAETLFTKAVADMQDRYETYKQMAGGGEAADQGE